MNFFNLDLHVSVIADISSIFHQLGHEVTSWSISGHTWVFGRQRDRVEVVNEQTWFKLNETMCDQFLDTYRAFLDQFDGFIVTHTPAFYLLYRKLGKPVIVVASTRYEYPFSFDRERWQWLNEELRAGIDRGQVIAVANNRYDAAYAEYFTGRRWQVIPSYCGYIGAGYTGRRKEFVYQSKYGGFPLSPAMVRKEQALPQRYQWPELFDYRGIVHVPYNASTMSIFEQYTAGVPLFFPTPRYLMALYRDNWHSGVLSEISYNQVHHVASGSAIGGALPGFADPNDYLDLANISRWIVLADYYDTTVMPGIRYFDSARQLEDMLGDAAIDDCTRVMQEANEWRRQKIDASWNELLTGIAKKVPGKFIDGVGGEAKVSIEQSRSAIGTEPLVSAIVSAYNSERFIRGCLEDLEAQTMADRLEIIVVDTGSPQNEWSIVREFQQRYDNIVYIRTARRESVYAAWNRGIQAARGMYITNANTDDRHKRDAFERLVSILETRPDIALVYADTYITETENETFEAHTPVGGFNWPDFDPLRLIDHCFMGPQPMWRKCMHTKYGYFDESFESAGDWEFWLRMAETETFLHLREYLGLYLNSPASAAHRNGELTGQENVRVRQRYLHRADRLKNESAVSGATVTKPMTIRADRLQNALAVSGATVTKPMAIKAYKLSDRAAVIQPAQAERDGDAAPGATSADRAIRTASRTGWVLLCPQGFEATWNGGPNPEDIAIRLDAAEDDAPTFVQSNLGGGLLTFYSGYQLHTTGSDSLWVRGPINWPKDGLYPLEQIVNTTLLPCTITVNWTFTRPHQTVRFAAGEPFGALLPYPKNASESFQCEVVPMEEAPEAYEHELQQLIQAPAIQDVLQRLQSAGEPAAMAEPPAVSVRKETAVSWPGRLTKSNPGPVENAPLAVVIPVRNRASQRLRNTLRSLAWQTAGRPAQVIVVSFGSRTDIDQDLAAICADEGVTLLTVGTPTQTWNKSFALNYGIRATRPEIPYLMTMDADMILASNFLAVVVQRLQRQPPALVLCRSSDLPAHSTLPDHPQQVLEAFQALHASSCLRDRTGTGGIQAAHRAFFFEIRGYDEDLIWWGAEDGDVVNRAQRMGLAIEWVEDRTAMLHQWHPRRDAGLTDPSEIEQAKNAWRHNHDLVQSRSTIAKRNPEGWGGIADAASDEAAYEQEIQRMVQNPALQTIFQRQQAGDEPVASPTVALADITGSWAAQLTDPPPVSCICPTYGRLELLEEAIYCFLLQDYPGPKELIVLNDYMEQTLVFDHPEVRVINVPKRFRTVGEKRNAGVALASHDLLFPWDDDDIYLPHRLSYSVAKFEAQKGFFKPSQGWYCDNGHLDGPAENGFHASSCWSRDRFDAVRGYDSEGSGHDQLFEERLAQRFPGVTATFAIQPAEIYYIYRWYSTGSYHLSGFGGLRPGENSGDAEVAAYLQRRASRGEIRQGRVLLQPHWNTDYQQLVSQYIQALAENQSQQRAPAVLVS